MAARGCKKWGCDGEKRRDWHIWTLSAKVAECRFAKSSELVLIQGASNTWLDWVSEGGYGKRPVDSVSKVNK